MQIYEYNSVKKVVEISNKLIFNKSNEVYSVRLEKDKSS